MGGFECAGSLSGSAPVVRVFQIGETCYTGQLLMGGDALDNCPGDTWVLDVAAQDSEDDFPILGICTGVYTLNDAGWSGTTGYGDTATLDATKATMVANDPIGQTKVEVTLTIPYNTLIKGPTYNGAYGTAITELITTAASSAGTTVTHTGITAIDYADDWGYCYCRSGANRGHYRTMITPGTAAQIMHDPFPYGIVTGDVFVTAGGFPGISGIQTGSTANYIDAAATLAAAGVWFGVYIHELNLEESGKEYYVFSLLASSGGPPGFQGL